MESFTIHTASPQSGRKVLAALAAFQAELLEGSDGYRVVVTLDKGDAEIVALLDALQDYVTERSSGPARVELDGRAYVMHPMPDAE